MGVSFFLFILLFDTACVTINYINDCNKYANLIQTLLYPFLQNIQSAQYELIEKRVKA